MFLFFVSVLFYSFPFTKRFLVIDIDLSVLKTKIYKRNENIKKKKLENMKVCVCG